MQLCCCARTPIINLCPTGNPEPPVASCPKQRLAKRGFGLTKCDGLQGTAVIACHDGTNMIGAHDIGLDDTHWSSGNTGGGPAHTIRATRLKCLDEGRRNSARCDHGIEQQTGLLTDHIDRAARDYLTVNGYGEAFFHRVGHGLGLAVHEEPYLVAGNDLPLAEGMTFSDEPGVYFPGKFGIRIEDTVVVTANGGEKLNHATRALTMLT